DHALAGIHGTRLAGIEEYADAASKTRLSVAKHVIGESERGREGLVVRSAPVCRHSLITGEQHAGRSVDEHLGFHALRVKVGTEDLDLAIDFMPREIGLPSHSVSQGQARTGFESVLEIKRVQVIAVALPLAV